MDNITLISCDYNTPLMEITMLRSFFKECYGVVNKVLVSVNSDKDDIDKYSMYDRAGIDYIKNPGMSHAEGVQSLLDNITTKYALLVDSDVIFVKNIKSVIEDYIKSKIVLGGHLDESGFDGNSWENSDFYKGMNIKINSRIHPCFMFINNSFLKKNNIKFANADKIEATKSSCFYNMFNGEHSIPGNEVPYYDVGGTLYEDVIEAKGKVNSSLVLSDYLIHFKGMSWVLNPLHDASVDVKNTAKSKYATYAKVYDKLKTVDIFNKFDGR